MRHGAQSDGMVLSTVDVVGGTQQRRSDVEMGPCQLLNIDTIVCWSDQFQAETAAVRQDQFSSRDAEALVPGFGFQAMSLRQAFGFGHAKPQATNRAETQMSCPQLSVFSVTMYAMYTEYRH